MKITISALIVVLAFYFAIPTYFDLGKNENSTFAVQQAKGAHVLRNGKYTPMTNVYIMRLGPLGDVYFIIFPDRAAIAALISSLAIASIFYFTRQKGVSKLTPVQQ
jgi:hypothetical protein